MFAWVASIAVMYVIGWAAASLRETLLEAGAAEEARTDREGMGQFASQPQP